MRKLKAAIAYECLTSFKHIWIFYGITFSIVGIILIIIGISTGDSEVRGTISLEVNSMVYVGILGVLGFKEDFKMLMQNGFTRKYIFIETLSLFAFISSILSLIDTIVSRVLHEAMLYDSVFGGLYGFDQPFIMNWLILFLFYLSVCCIMYLGVLTVNRLGKRKSLVIGLGLLLILALLLPAIFRYVLDNSARDTTVELLLKSLGILPGGRVALVNPCILFIALISVFGLASYLVIRRTELKI